MSSVNSDITKEIDELLRKKQNGFGNNNNGRPSSISNAGKQILSKQGYAYDGITLSKFSIIQTQTLAEHQVQMALQTQKE